MSWQGRQLASASKDGKSLSFTYDSDGIRTSKTVGSTTTKYLLNGTQILAQKTGSSTLCFFYDQQGNRVGMADGNNHFYYYIYNVQGDVIALADASTGKLAATYTYDAWGKIVKINGQNPEDVASTNIANINPFRYRGYYYDTETKLYYLQSRYYDPEVGRFINADAFASTDISGVLSTNMFAYCENRPTVGSDPTGEWVHVAVGAVIGGLSSYLMSRALGESQEMALKAGLMGAASGAVSALLPGAGPAIDIAFNSVDTIISGIMAGDSYETIVVDTFISASFGAVSGSSNGYLASKQATKEIREVVGSIPKMKKGNPHKIKQDAKNNAKKTITKAAKSFASMVGLSSFASWANNKISKWLK